MLIQNKRKNSMKTTKLLAVVAILAGCTGNIDLSLDNPNGAPSDDPNDPNYVPPGTDPNNPDGGTPIVSGNTDRPLGDPAETWFFTNFEAHQSDPEARLLTLREMASRLSAVLGVQPDLSELPENSMVVGMPNHSVSNRVATAQHAMALLQLANKTALAANTSVLLGCTDSCTQQDVNGALESLFLRPPTSSESTAAWTAYDRARNQNVPDPERAVLQWAVMTPGMLYRFEYGLTQQNTDLNQLAMKLSFFLTGEAPDVQLVAAARDGSLGDPAGYEAQVDRLLGTTAFEKQLHYFFELWLGVSRVDLSHSDTEGYTASLSDMRAEFTAMVQNIILEEKGGLAALINSERTWINSALGGEYEFERPAGTGLVETSLAGTDRRGILTTALVMTANSKTTGRSPIRRGKMLLEKLGCSEFPPNAGQVVMLLPDSTNTETTLREKFAVLEETAPCMNCHQTLNAGFAFDYFDHLGRRYDASEVLPEEVIADFNLSPYETMTFEGPVSAAEQLSDHPAVQRCFVAQAFRLAQGRFIGKQDVSDFDAIVAAFGQNDQPQDLFRRIALSASFKFSGDAQ